MCGIFGYAGNKSNAAQVTLDGLKRLDYRGYDSWGIATLSSGKITIIKDVGKIENVTLNSLPREARPGRTKWGQFAIGHTRWATTGKVTKINAHPHYASDKSFALAQNGIVDNYKELKNLLIKKGHLFKSQTDTEVIVRLIEEELKKTEDLRTAIQVAFSKLKGRSTIIILTKDNQILAARNGSPLVIGVNQETGEFYFSSDTLSFASFAQKTIVVNNGELAHLNGQLKIYNIRNNHEIKYKFEDINLTNTKISKGGFDHYMLKEIFDSPKVITQLLIQDEKSFIKFAKTIKKARRVYTIGSGTAGVAAAQIAFYLRHFAKIEAASLIGADAKEYYPLFTNKDLIIAPSQSGETADVLEVLELAKKKGVKIASLVNMPGSIMTRISDFKFMSEAGPEICVMSTKVFTSQIAWGYLIAKTAAGLAKEGRTNLRNTAKQIQKYLDNTDNHKKLHKLSQQLRDAKDIFLIGKNQNLQIIREGMIKIIEGSYKHASAIPAGDLKHYAITLMEKGIPVIAVLSEDSTKPEVLNAVNQIRARGAQVIAIAPKNNESFDYHISVPDIGETSNILNIIPLQLLAYYLARQLGNNIDKPRNIAKSVTVK